jgi:hypothetical protein
MIDDSAACCNTSFMQGEKSAMARNVGKCIEPDATYSDVSNSSDAIGSWFREKDARNIGYILWSSWMVNL